MRDDDPADPGPMPEFLKRAAQERDQKRQEEKAAKPPIREKAEKLPVPPRRSAESVLPLDAAKMKSMGFRPTKKKTPPAESPAPEAKPKKESEPMRTETATSEKPKAPPVVKKAKAPKAKVAAKAKPAPKAKAGKSISEMAREGIHAGLDNETILAKIKKAHPECNTNKNNISWYRMDERRKGRLTDTAAGQKAKATLKKAAAKKRSKKVN